ncbi:hypothetical protein VP01_1250g7 [Puccinia sorghi]|uniref:Uncharacterized protein n=1 Tax=Puccinia sorghi TaxID=27349 RepID=A0A0L6VPP8_9BASI|nr:hypothetical protein VP01_1250g7 [Puccinia sorghi]
MNLSAIVDDDELYNSFNYRPDPEESLDHLHHEQVHGASPREDIERIRAQLDESLAQDTTFKRYSPRSRSWDEPSMSVPDHRSPHHRAFEAYPSAGLRPTLERPLSRSGIPYPTMSADEKTGLHSASSRSGLDYPDVPDLRSPYLSGGRQSPHLGHTAWPSSSSAAAAATRSPLMTDHAHHQSVGTGAALHHHQDSLREQLHQIHDLDNHIRESELAHQREQARVDRTAAELARLSLADDIRRSEEVNRDREAHQREQARADRSAAELARLSVANDLRRAEEVNRDTQRALATQHFSQLSHQSRAKDLERDVAAAYQRELALADQRVSSQLTQQSLAQDLERRNAMASHQRDLAALAHDQRVSSQLGQQRSILQAARENEMYRELDQLRHQLDLERAQIARQRERVDTQTQLDSIDRQLRALDRQREIDRNRQMANLTRFGNLPSVLRGNYQRRPLASPYLQQSRFLTAARRWSARDKAPRSHRSPLVYDHVDAYYRLISDHLPRQLPLFKDPYYHPDSHHSTKNGGPRNGLRPRLLGREMSNPFVEGIDYDYGYGKVGRLEMKLEQFAREQAYILDDLYLFELLIRLDESIDEVERGRRWQARMGWEECLDSRGRVEAWSRMSGEERRRLGVSEGSYWASSLFGIPLDGRFGYQNFSTLGASRYSPSLSRRAHYPLSSRLASRYPMWNRGGLGLGRRLSNWLDHAPPPHPPLIDHHQLVNTQQPIPRDFPLRRRSSSFLGLPPSSLTTGLPRPSFSDD